MFGTPKRETCSPQTFGHRPIYTSRRFYIFMRRNDLLPPSGEVPKAIGACQRPSNNAQYTVVLPPLPFGELPRWGAKNVLPLNLIALPNGEGCDTRMLLFSHCQNKYTHMWKKNNDGQSLPRVGKVASGASRIGF